METILSFGVWIKRRRKALDLTQDDLARLVGCSLETIRKIEGDARRPSRQIAALLAEHLALPPEERDAFIRCARAELSADRLPPPAHAAPRAAFVSAPPPPEPAPDPPWSNLPAQPNALVGREREIAEVTMLLRTGDVRLLTLTGPGGTGKTRLAIAAAESLALAHNPSPDAAEQALTPSSPPSALRPSPIAMGEGSEPSSPALPPRRESGSGGEGHFPDGVWFVNLAPIRESALVLPTIAQALGVIEMGVQPIDQRLKAYLRPKRTLLLLDNFEQVIDAAPQIADLLAAAPGLRVLATSRATLHIYGEHEYAVPPLALPPTTDDGRQMTDDHVASIGDLISQYEAVRLFIARAQAAKADFAITNANARAVAEICRRLDGLPLAIELAAARIKLFSPEALLARLGHSLQLLTGGPRNLPERQQTLRNTIDWSYNLLDAGEQALFRRLGVFVGGCTLEAADAVLRTEGRVLSTESSALSPQSSVLDGLASLVNQSLLHQEEGADGEPRFVMLETVREYALERLEERREEDATRRRHAEYFLALAESAAPQLHMAGQRTWLARLEAEHSNLRAALVWSQTADIRADFGLQLATALAEFWEVRGHRYEGSIWLSSMLPHVPEPTLLRAKALNATGLLTLDADTIGAHTLFEESFMIAHTLGDKKCLADARLGLGWSDNDDGVRQNHILSGLALYQNLNDKAGQAKALGLLAAVTKDLGDLQQALTLAEESLALYRELEDRLGCAWPLEALGRITRELGHDRRAAAYIQETLALCRNLGDQAREIGALLALADVNQLQGDYGRAEDVLTEALALSQKVGDRSASAWALNNLGDLILYRGDTARARQVFAHSIMLFHSLGRTFGIAQCLLGFAGTAIADKQPRRAARLWSAGVVLIESFGSSIETLPPDDEVHYDRTIAAIHAQLDEATFATAWAEGQKMTLEQAIEEALSGSAISNDQSVGSGRRRSSQ